MGASRGEPPAGSASHQMDDPALGKSTTDLTLLLRVWHDVPRMVACDPHRELTLRPPNRKMPDRPPRSEKMAKDRRKELGEMGRQYQSSPRSRCEFAAGLGRGGHCRGVFIWT